MGVLHRKCLFAPNGYSNHFAIQENPIVIKVDIFGIELPATNYGKYSLRVN